MKNARKAFVLPRYYCQSKANYYRSNKYSRAWNKLFQGMEVTEGKGITTLFHEPFGRGGSTTDAYCLDAFEPLRIYFIRTLNEMGVRIDAQAFVEQHLSITALSATDEKDQVVTAGKVRDVGHSIGDITADGVEALKGGLWRDVLPYVFYDALKLVKRLRCLGIEINIMREIKPLGIFEFLNHDGMSFGLAYKS